MKLTKDIKKLAPWNWFKDEEKETGGSVSTANDSLYAPASYYGFSPLAQLHQDMDRLFYNMLQSFGDFADGNNSHNSRSNMLLRPNVDISATDKEYRIEVDVPGVEEDDVQLELNNDMLIVKGERKQEQESSEKGFYRIERSYGAFRRVLSLPQDADQDNISAEFKNGVLTISLPRKAEPKGNMRQIDIKKAA